MKLLKECDIQNLIKSLKLSGEKVHSNCFYHFSNIESVWEGDCSGQSLFVVNEEKGVKRIWFYTISFEDLQRLIQDTLDDTQEYLIDIVSKDKKMYYNDLSVAGFELFTCMTRMANKDITDIWEGDSPVLSYEGKAEGEKPTVTDAETIKNKLWEIFDTRISHLPNQSEVEDSIKNGEFTIYRNDDFEIVTILQSVVKPSSFYINQVYNVADKEIIHSILLEELIKYHEHGGKYLYAWVEESNIASQKFHRKYGMYHDGLWDVIYIRKRR